MDVGKQKIFMQFQHFSKEKPQNNLNLLGIIPACLYVTLSKPVYIELASSKKVSTKICAVQNGCNGLLQKKEVQKLFLSWEFL